MSTKFKLTLDRQINDNLFKVHWFSKAKMTCNHNASTDDFCSVALLSIVLLFLGKLDLSSFAYLSSCP